MAISRDQFIFTGNDGKVVKWQCFTELSLPDSIIQKIEATAIKDNVNIGFEFHDQDLQCFEVADEDDDSLEPPLPYRDISTESQE